jgi:hypothetical protein
MLLEDSYFSRFFTKFVEIVAGGLATAMCAYLIAHVGDPLSSATPAPTAVSAASTTGEVAAGLPAQPAPPVATAAVEGQHRATQPVTDAPARPAPKGEKAATAVPAPKDNKASASPAARSEKSAEALARAALANLDADRPAPADAPVRRNLSGAGAAAVEFQQRTADMPPRPADVQPPLVAVDAQERRVATLDPPPPNAGSPSEVASPRPESQPHQDKGLVSFLKRMPDLLRPGAPSFDGEAPRPPMPVGAPPSE